MKFRPILFSTDMVRAIQEGNKTQTRRVMKDEMLQENKDAEVEEIIKLTTLPKYYPGDILWVRETWRMTDWDLDSQQMEIDFKAGGCPIAVDLPEDDEWIDRQIDRLESTGYIKYDEEENPDAFVQVKFFPWKPSIFMPKEACRIFLEITDVSVERLQDISEEDAQAEGVIQLDGDKWKNYYSPLNNMMEDGWPDAYHSFQSLWEEINGANSFEENPWVWVVKFREIEKPEGWPK